MASPKYEIRCFDSSGARPDGRSDEFRERNYLEWLAILV